MKTYSPGDISVVFAGILVTGYAPDTFCEIEHTSDAFTMTVGAGGEVARTRSQDRTGMIKVTLMMTSPINDQLNAVASADAATGAGAAEIQVKDLNGTSIASGSQAWIKKKPVKVYAKEIQALEWVFDVADLTHNVGGTKG